MTLDEATKQYWRFSQHLAALTNTAEREAFLMFTVMPTITSSTNQRQKELLGRLIDRGAKVATA